MTEGRRSHTLTKDEFQLLLQRAAERDVFREPRIFSLPELVEAGREIGIAAASVEEVYGEYQQGQRQALQRRPAPLGLRFHLASTGDALQLIQRPPKNAFPIALRLLVPAAVGTVAVLGTQLGLWVTLPVAVVLGVTAFIGLTMHGRGAAYDLRLRRDGSGLLLRQVGSRVESFPLMAGQVHARPATRPLSRREPTVMVPFLALDHGIHTFALLENYSHAELVWAAQEIEAWLGR